MFQGDDRGGKRGSKRENTDSPKSVRKYLQEGKGLNLIRKKKEGDGEQHRKQEAKGSGTKKERKAIKKKSYYGRQQTPNSVIES